MMGLKKEAMRRGCSFQTLLAQLIEEITRRIVGHETPRPTA
jgi:predicted small metal-binding protein